MADIDYITNMSVYNLSKAVPNKLLNADGSITDFQGNIITPANKSYAEVYEKTRAVANKFITENDEIKTYAEINLNIFVVVDSLPKEGEKNKIYLVPNNDGTFTEYYYNENDKWDPIGNVNIDGIDLSDYPTFIQMNDAIDTAIFGALGGEY
ncbi:MAG: hypothetical protein K2P14_10260 [Anaeroplasmataceae bacterium]|nr:hypothetical protein [Anaeroplasmataceae bacterium]